MIVLSYAPDDVLRVARFYQVFQEAGLIPWMDSIDRPPGALWERALSVAIRRCDVLVIFLSERSVDKHGLLRKELSQAISNWKEKEADDVYVVLARLEACKIPEQLENFPKFEALDDVKTPKLVTLLRILHGRTTGTLDFLPTKLEYKQRQIFPKSPTHCDIGVTIPQFDPGDNDLLAAANSLIAGRLRIFWKRFWCRRAPDYRGKLRSWA